MSRAAQISTALFVAAAVLVAVRFGSGGRAAPEPSASLSAEASATEGGAETRRIPLELARSEEPVAEPAHVEPTLAAPTAERTSLADDRPRIAGRVRVAGGLADDAVRVVAEVQLGAGEPTARASASVAGDGAFVLVLPLGARSAQLELEAETLALAEAPWVLAGATGVELVAQRLARLELEVVPPAGVVADPARLESVRVGLHVTPGSGLDRRRQKEDTLATHALDARGRCVIGSVPLEIVLWLEVTHPFGPSWSERLAPFAAGEVRALRVELETGFTVAGRVVDEAGQPVAGVRVRAREVQGAADSGTVLGVSSGQPTTDAEGAFRFESLARRPWQLSASGSAIVSSETRTLDGSADVLDLVLRAERGAVLTGTVTWAGGEPVQRGEVRLTWAGRSRGASFRRGRFELRAPPGAYALEIHAVEGERRGSARAEVVADGTPLHFVLEELPTRALRGVVVDVHGQPVAGYRVWWSGGRDSGSETRREEDGSFVLTALPPGELELTLSAPGHFTLVERVDPDIGTGAPLRFVLQPACVVRGSVQDERGLVVPGATVVFSVEGRVMCGSGSDGRFELQGHREEFPLYAMMSGYVSGAPVAVELRPGGEVQDVVLRLERAGNLAGRVLDAQGRALEGAQVHIVPLAEVQEFAFLPRARTDFEGRFLLVDVPPRSLRVVVSDSSGASASADVTVRAGETSEVELRVGL